MPAAQSHQDLDRMLQRLGSVFGRFPLFSCTPVFRIAGDLRFGFFVGDCLHETGR